MCVAVRYIGDSELEGKDLGQRTRRYGRQSTEEPSKTKLLLEGTRGHTSSECGPATDPHRDLATLRVSTPEEMRRRPVDRYRTREAGVSFSQVPK
jgi:hypothetical protein